MQRSDLYGHHFANEKLNRLKEGKHFAQGPQLATGGTAAIRSPGRFVNKGMIILDVAQRRWPQSSKSQEPERRPRGGQSISL